MDDVYKNKINEYFESMIYQNINAAPDKSIVHSPFF